MFRLCHQVSRSVAVCWKQTEGGERELPAQAGTGSGRKRRPGTSRAGQRLLPTGPGAEAGFLGSRGLLGKALPLIRAQRWAPLPACPRLRPSCPAAQPRARCACRAPRENQQRLIPGLCPAAGCAPGDSNQRLAPDRAPSGSSLVLVQRKADMGRAQRTGGLRRATTAWHALCTAWERGGPRCCLAVRA